MATAISFVSESSDHYLNLFDNGESIEEIVSKLTTDFDMEFAHLEVKNCVSSDHDTQEVCQAVCAAIDEAYEE